jgi:Protein of unknown function (DUF2612)
MSTPIDHVVLGLSRVTQEYQQAPDFLAYLSALLVAPADIEAAGQAVEASLDIDVAVGTQLDLIGRLIGLSRDVPNGYPLPFFGFLDTPAGLPYGDTAVGGGGLFYEAGAVSTTTWHLDDITYRKFLHARVLRNRSTGAIPDFVAILQLIFPSDDIIVQDVDGQPQVAIGINRVTTVSETVTLNYPGILPKPAGVALIVLPYTAFVAYFGFNPSDATYGDLTVGGGGPFKERDYP